MAGDEGWDLDWAALGEVAGLVFLVEAYTYGMLPKAPPLWIAIAAATACSHIVHGEGPAELGLGLKAFAAAFPPTLSIVAPLAATGSAAAVFLGTVRPITPAAGLDQLLHYFWWGLVQQYVLNALLLNRLMLFFGPGRKAAAAVAAALLFGAAHLPNWFLVAVAIPGGLAASAGYLRFRSLYALGLAHGAIGTLIYVAVPDWMSGGLLVGPHFHG